MKNPLLRKNRFLPLLMLVFCTFSMLVSMLAINPQTTSAEKTNNNTDNNFLKLVQECQGFKKSDKWDRCAKVTGNFIATKDGNNSLQETFNHELSCGTSMFDQANDPNGQGAKLDSWFIDATQYANCVGKANAKLNGVLSKCGKLKRGNGNWDFCEKEQNRLQSTLGCPKLFKSSGGKDYFIIDQAKVNDCKGRIKAAGAVQIKNADGSTSPVIGTSGAQSNTGGEGNGGGNGNGGGTNDELKCAQSNLSWIICPTIKLLNDFTGLLDALINSQLAIGSDGKSNEPVTIFADPSGKCGPGNACDAYYTAWRSFRNIALGLLAIVGLIVVITQALGMEILDAYTLRKTLPRVLIAALGITLSWQLMQFFVGFSNALGYGVRNLIYAPFLNLDGFDLSFGGIGIIGVGAGITYLAVGAFGLFTLAATGAMAVGIALIVLVLRQIAVIMMIIMAPIAIIAYVLPNTQSVYKLWWESFSKALMMFPLIEGFIAAGRVFAAISFTAKGVNGSGDLYQVIGFLAYFAPYFLIPATFKFAGGAIRQIGGFVNDRSRGAFDALRTKRKENTAKRIKAARTGGIYRNDLLAFKLRPGGKQYGLGRALNLAGNYSLDAGDTLRWKAGRRGPGRLFFGRKSDILQEKIDHQRLEHSRKAEQDLGLHYASGRALSGQLQYFFDPAKGGRGFTEGQGLAAKQNIDKLFGVKDSQGKVVAYRTPQGKKETEQLAHYLSQSTDVSDSSGALLAAQELHAKAGMIGDLKGAGKEETQRADLRTIGLLSAAKAGRLENSELAAEHANWSADRINEGYAVQATNMLQDAAVQKRPSQARGQGLAYDGSGKAYSVYEAYDSDDAQKSLMRLNTQEVGAAKSEDLDETAQAWIWALSDNDVTVEKVNGKWVTSARYDDNGQLKTKDAKQRAQSKQLRDRISAMATYNYGDSDVGRKLNDIYQAADFKGASGKKPPINRHDPDDPAVTQPRPPAPADDQGGQGGP